MLSTETEIAAPFDVAWVRSQFPALSQTVNAVSYTHLTLPTICSV